MNFANYLTGTQAWVEILVIIVLLFLMYWAVTPFVRMIFKVTTVPNGFILYRMIFARSLVMFCAIFALFYAYGPTLKVETTLTDSEMVVDKIFKEKDVETIRKEAYEGKNKFLKKQDDSSFAEEEREADEYIERLLKNKE